MKNTPRLLTILCSLLASCILQTKQLQAIEYFGEQYCIVANQADTEPETPLSLRSYLNSFNDNVVPFCREKVSFEHAFTVQIHPVKSSLYISRPGDIDEDNNGRNFILDGKANGNNATLDGSNLPGNDPLLVINTPNILLKDLILVAPSCNQAVSVQNGNTPSYQDITITNNANQTDNSDNDRWGDSCDNCDQIDNSDQSDDDNDGFGNACDTCPGHNDNNDADNDNVPDGCDVCPGGNDNTDTDNDGVPNFAISALSVMITTTETTTACPMPVISV